MILPQSLIFIFGLSYLSSYDQIIKNTDVPRPDSKTVQVQVTKVEVEVVRGQNESSIKTTSRQTKTIFSVGATRKPLKLKNHRNRIWPLKLKPYLVAGHY